MTVARFVAREIVHEVVSFGDLEVRVHFPAVIDCAENFGRGEGELLLEMLAVAPGCETGEFADCPFDHFGLSTGRALRVVRSDSSKTDAGKQHQQWPPAAK